MRKYEETHPWLNFKIDLSKLSFKIWMLIGEAQSKCLHLSNVPILPSLQQNLKQIYLAKGINATTAIEGNTLSEKQVLDHINGKLNLPKSQEYLKQEIDNMLNLFNDLTNKIEKQPDELKRINLDKIKEYNKNILHNLELTEEVIPGGIRTHNVRVGKYSAVDYEDCQYLLNEFSIMLENFNDFISQNKEFEISFGIIKSIIAHLYFNWIHPFGDGNGRTARLIEFQLLLSSGVPAIAAHILANHYNITRNKYYLELEKATKKQNMDEFIEYAIRGFIDGLREQISMVQEDQWTSLAMSLIENEFDEKEKSKVNERRKSLARIILLNRDTDQSFTLNNIMKKHPRIAEKYIKLIDNDRALYNDLKELCNINLIIKEGKDYKFNIGLLSFFKTDTMVKKI